MVGWVGRQAYNDGNIRFLPDFNHDLDIWRAPGVPSRSGLGKASILRPIDDGCLGQTSTQLALNFGTIYMATGYGIDVKERRDGSSGNEKLKQSQAKEGQENGFHLCLLESLKKLSGLV